MYTNLFILFDQLNYKSESLKEQWAFLSLSGIYKSDIELVFEKVIDELNKLEIIQLVSLKINKRIVNTEDFVGLLVSGIDWEIHINKSPLIDKLKTDKNYSQNFFYSKTHLINWIKNSSPFDSEHPFNKHSKIKIIVYKLDRSFGGSNFIVTNSLLDDFKEAPNLPEELDILNYVHVFINDGYKINVINHLVLFGVCDEVSSCFFRNSILELISSLCSEINNDDKIILRGIRRIPLVLGSDSADTSNSYFNNLLIRTVTWVYSDKNKCDLKHKLLLERITLDINLEKPLISGLQTVLESALEQAKERYDFIVFDKKDLYQNELKDLLKDLKTMSELYSSKVRTLLSNLLRDVLAALLLVGITLFSQQSNIKKLLENDLISYAFNAFGIYFIVSALFQLIIDFFDSRRTIKEFDHWQTTTKDYMSADTFKKYKKEGIGRRMIDAAIMYGTICLCYFALSYLCFHVVDYWKFIINK